MAESTTSKLRYYKDEIAIGLLVLLMYIPTFLWMWDRWFDRDSYYSHGVLVPFVVAYLIWQKKDAILRLPRESSPWGMYLFLGGIVMHLVSALFRIYFSSGFSLILVVTGLVLHFGGKKVLRQLVFPIMFLVFMIPIPIVSIANITFQLKIFAAQLASTILNNHLRIPCIQDGSVIRLQHTQVIVDDVCSGLRSLMALMALGSIFAHWMKGGLLKRVFVFSLSIPIAVITNAMRIVFLSSVSEIWGAQYAVGLMHDVSGFIVFALAFMLMFAAVKLLE